QAEDGIRYDLVTGVQTCALPISRDRAAPLSPVARRAAAGAAETLPLFQVTNLARTLEELKEAGLWIIGTAADAEQTVFQADLKRSEERRGGKGGSWWRARECDMR